MKRITAIGFAALAVAIVPVTHATDNSWTNSASGKWEDASNWSLGAAPSVSDSSELITNAVSKTITIDATTSGGFPTTMTVSNVTLSSPSGTTNVLEIVNADTNAAFHVLGSASIGSRSRLSVSNSQVQVDNYATITGEFSLLDGAASFPLSGGGTLFNVIISGGTMTIAGGTVTTGGQQALAVGWTFGTGTATLWVTGGNLILTNTYFNVGSASFSGPGRVTISNGSVRVREAYIGGSGFGTLTVAGGTLLTSSFLSIGSWSAGAKGTAWITGTGAVVGCGGSLTVGQNFTAGEMTLSNGTVSTGLLVIPWNSNTNKMSVVGGTLTTTSDLRCTGPAWVKGGNLIVSGSIFLGYENDFPSPLTVSNGTVSCQRLVVSDFVSQFVPRTGRGTLTMAGGTVRVSSELDVGDCLSKRTGTVFITGGSLFVTNSAQTASIVVSGGTFTMTGGTVIADRFVMTNSCAQFVRTGGTLIYGNAILATNLDADGDGLPNGWEQAYGLDPLNAADATTDNDGDGMSNLQESLTGTDPTNSSSAFRVLSVVATNDDMLVTWSCGGGRTNVVQSAPDVGGSYSNVSPNVVLSGSGDVTTNYLDVGAVTNAVNRYHRIRLVP